MPKNEEKPLGLMFKVHFVPFYSISSISKYFRKIVVVALLYSVNRPPPTTRYILCKSCKKNKSWNDIPEMTLDPLYHVTLGIGLPPPDSQTKRSSWPSLKGPMISVVMSLPSARDTFKYLGLAVNNTSRYVSKYTI